MRIKKSISIFLLSATLCSGCKTIKLSFYSYNVETYTIDSVRTDKFLQSFVTYGDHLFEFKLKTNNHYNVVGNTVTKTSTSYDTLGVYLLNGKLKRFFEFDSFSASCHFIQTGPFSKMEGGMKLVPVNSDSTPTQYGSIVKVMINGIQCYAAEINYKEKPVDMDSTIIKMLLIKKKNFNSIFRINGVNFPDPAFCIVGFQESLPAEHLELRQEIKDLRPLTEEEKNICQAMLKKAGLQAAL